MFGSHNKYDWEFSRECKNQRKLNQYYAIGRKIKSSKSISGTIHTRYSLNNMFQKLGKGAIFQYT